MESYARLRAEMYHNSMVAYLKCEIAEPGFTTCFMQTWDGAPKCPYCSLGWKALIRRMRKAAPSEPTPRFLHRCWPGALSPHFFPANGRNCISCDGNILNIQRWAAGIEGLRSRCRHCLAPRRLQLNIVSTYKVDSDAALAIAVSFTNSGGDRILGYCADAAPFSYKGHPEATLAWHFRNVHLSILESDLPSRRLWRSGDYLSRNQAWLLSDVEEETKEEAWILAGLRSFQVTFFLRPAPDDGDKALPQWELTQLLFQDTSSSAAFSEMVSSLKGLGWDAETVRWHNA